MPNIKVSGLSITRTLGPNDLFMVVQGSTNLINKKVTLTDLLKNLESSDNIKVNSLQNMINFSVASKNDPYALFVRGSNDRVAIGTDDPKSKFHVIGNIQIGSTTQDGVLLQSSESLTYSSSDQTNSVVKQISSMRGITVLNNETGVNGQYELSIGFNGQVKTIVQNSVDAGKTSTISVSGGLDFNTITLNAEGDTVRLQYIPSLGKWVVVGDHGSPVYSTL